MIDHSGISVTDFDRSKAFYEQALAPLGASFLVLVPQNPPVHFAFSAATRDQVDAFYAAAIAAGGVDNGKPGLRPHYHASYYGAFVRDLDGNNIEAVCHAPG